MPIPRIRIRKAGTCVSDSVYSGKGVREIEAYIKHLVGRYVDSLTELGLHVVGPKDEKHMTAIPSFYFGFDNGSVARGRDMVYYLQERNIFVSLRSSTGTGGVRIPFHFYNTGEVQIALAAIREN